MDVTYILGEIFNETLIEEMETCKQFHVESEIKNARHRTPNFDWKLLDAQILSKNIDRMFQNLKRLAKLNVAFGFLLKNVEGSCRFYYAHENKTLMERLNFEATKKVLVEIKNVFSNTDLINACKKEQAITDCKF